MQTGACERLTLAASEQATLSSHMVNHIITSW